MRFELRSISLWSILKVSFFLNLIIGFLYGILYAMLFSLFLSFSQFMPMDQYGVDTSELPVAILFVMFPILFSIGGAVVMTFFCIIFAMIYNLVAKLLGGYEFDLANVGELKTSIAAAEKVVPIAKVRPDLPKPGVGSHPPPPPLPPHQKLNLPDVQSEGKPLSSDPKPFRSDLFHSEGDESLDSKKDDSDENGSGGTTPLS